MNCSLDKYLKQVEAYVKEQGATEKNLGKEIFYAIKSSASEEINKELEAYLTEKAKGNTKLVTAEETKEGEITKITIGDNGRLLATVRVDGSTPTYKVDPSSGVTVNGVKIERLEGFEYKFFHKNNSNVNQFGNFSRPLSEASRRTNEYASRVLIGTVESNLEVLSPYISSLHENLKKNIRLYNEVSNLLNNSFGNLGLLDKLQATIFMTGDIDIKQMSDLTSIENQITRRNYQILQDDLPKLDEKVKEIVTNPNARKRVNKLFGRINIGALPTDILNRLVDSESLVDIVGSIKATADEKARARNLMKYMLDRKVKNNVQNSQYNETVATLATLYALQANGEQLYTQFRWLKNKDADLHAQLLQLSITVSMLNKSVQHGTDAKSLGRGSGYQYRGFDEYGTIDVFDTAKEFRPVTLAEYDLERGYEHTPWTVIVKPTETTVGIIARKSVNGSQTGLGVNENRIMNGVLLDSNYVKEQIAKHGDDWLNENNVLYDDDNGYTRYRKVLTENEYNKAKGMENVAHTLWRSYVHNKALIETEKARSMIADSMTIDGTEGALKSLEYKLKFNKQARREDRKVIQPFIKSDLSYAELKKDYPLIAKKYKKVSGVTNYGKFNEDITYVRADMADMLIGYKQGTFAPDDWPVLAYWENIYKELLQLFKLKLVVADPEKLGVDFLSNLGILMTMDVPADEVFYYGKEAISLSHEMSKIETSLVDKKVQLTLAEASKDEKKIAKAKAEVEKVQKQMEDHPYYEAIQNGFVQSLGTEMILKNFDTVTGLQHTIDTVVEKIVKDEKGNPNIVHKAAVVLMNAGFGANDVLDAVGNMSKLKGTSFGEELVEMADRLKRQKDKEDTVRYISEFIAAPSSEIVRQGSRAMQMGDAIARWSLYNSKIKQGLIAKGLKVQNIDSSKDLQKFLTDAISKGKITAEAVKAIKDDAAMEALHTFIDYRLNMPKEIQFLSDYGILMFPSFWIRAQKIIFNLAKFHPVNAGGGYITADLLNLHGASILDANLPEKVIRGTAVHAGQDVLTPDTFFMHITNLFR